MVSQDTSSEARSVQRGALVVETLMALAVMAVGLAFLRIVHGPSAPYGDPADIGSAAFFPGLVALLVTGLGLVLLLSTWRRRFELTIDKGSTGRALAAYALMLALVLLIDVLGIWLCAMLAVPLLALCFGERRPVVLLILAVVPPTLVIHLFEGVMGVYFPRGILL